MINNIYILLSTILILLFIQKNIINASKRILVYVILVFTIIWIFNDFIINSIYNRNLITRISSHLIICFSAIYCLYKNIFFDQKELLRNSLFIIIIGLVLNSSYRFIFELIYFIAKSIDTKLDLAILSILIYVNFISYIIFTYGLICIKSRQKLISQF